MSKLMVGTALGVLLCMAAAPEVFEVRDDDFLYVLQDEPSEELRDKVEEAARRCPKQAITIEG